MFVEFAKEKLLMGMLAANEYINARAHKALGLEHPIQITTAGSVESNDISVTFTNLPLLDDRSKEVDSTGNFAEIVRAICATIVAGYNNSPESDQAKSFKCDRTVTQIDKTTCEEVYTFKVAVELNTYSRSVKAKVKK
ncbi:hypothetical protein VB834_15880 [Limnoraphis robusta Tam1]|uniref:hypothetical protein n=1 Tax=Limnoraphis robusta TaxID=1118279 RepID=UPI002B20264D|nr:hypothetical protein [Limnoraphis robusta]MEA5540506.1 hypothetical protein [Limnoraphis robusta Tam1]